MCSLAIQSRAEGLRVGWILIEWLNMIIHSVTFSIVKVELMLCPNILILVKFKHIYSSKMWDVYNFEKL